GLLRPRHGSRTPLPVWQSRADSDSSSTGHAEAIRILSVSHLLRFASGFFGALLPRRGYFQENGPIFRCSFFGKAAAVLRKLAILFGTLHDTSPMCNGSACSKSELATRSQSSGSKLEFVWNLVALT